MKNFYKIILAFVLICSTVFGFVGCGKKDPCDVTISASELEGIEISCSTSYTAEDGTTKDGCFYDGSISISASLKEGYDWGSFELTINNKKASENSYYVSCTTTNESKTKEFLFEGVRKDLTVSYSGEAEKIAYTVTIQLEEDSLNSSLTQEDRQNIMVKYNYIKDGETTQNTYKSWESLKAELEARSKEETLHYGDKIIFSYYYNKEHASIINLTNGLNGKISYKRIENERIEVSEEIEITTGLTIKLDERIIGIDNYVGVSLQSDDYMESANGVIQKGEVTTEKPLIQYEEGSNYSISYDLTGNEVFIMIAENRANSLIKFFVNGYELDKSNVEYASSNKILKFNSLKAPYEYYNQTTGEYLTNPEWYTIKIAGVEEFLKTKEDLLICAPTIENINPNISVSYLVLPFNGKLIKSTDIQLKIEIEESALMEFNVIIKYADGTQDQISKLNEVLTSVSGGIYFAVCTQQSGVFKWELTMQKPVSVIEFVS